MAEPILKKCSTCERLLPLEEYRRAAAGKHGRASRCRECQKVIDYEYRNRPEVKEYQRKYKAKRYLDPAYRKRQYLNAQKPERKAQKRKRSARYRAENKDKLAEYMVEYCQREHAKKLRREASLRYEARYLAKHGETRSAAKSRAWRKTVAGDIHSRISRQVVRALEKGKQGGSLWDYVDYSLDELIGHLESKFKPGMSWENRGEWHIDHIRPVASFDVKELACKEFKKCWALDNLQPLWAHENFRKGDKWEGRA